jgi:hypothetical protein
MTPTTPATSPPQSTRTLLLGLLLVVMLASGWAELVSLVAVASP